MTFGDPTGFAINARPTAPRLTAAKEFLAYVESEKAAKSLAEIGITPALVTDAVDEDLLRPVTGVPTDVAVEVRLGQPEDRPGEPGVAEHRRIADALNATHTAIMSGSTPVGKGHQRRRRPSSRTRSADLTAGAGARSRAPHPTPHFPEL